MVSSHEFLHNSSSAYVTCHQNVGYMSINGCVEWKRGKYGLVFLKYPFGNHPKIHGICRWCVCKCIFAHCHDSANWYMCTIFHSFGLFSNELSMLFMNEYYLYIYYTYRSTLQWNIVRTHARKSISTYKRYFR